MRRPKNNNSNIQELKKENKNDNLILTARFEGPLPHPSILDGYAKINPDIPNRIIKMAEEQSKARIDNEKKENENIIELRKTALNSEVSYNKRAQCFGFILLLILFLAGPILIVLNKDVGGYLSVMVGIIGAVGSILYNNKKQD
ncbi:DUF2335 domain-containing protein [Streptobacillus ratti]|uniref:DUF2335 domain-containing protein n=1 Tax=Streptobacillus ratti TaxID=1720557 RepID=UPI0009330BCD|nr:DUF2335 domain-containing protein [Streptobacillus ratti]